MNRLLSPVLLLSATLQGAPQAAPAPPAGRPAATPTPAAAAPTPAPTRTLTPKETEQYQKYLEAREAVNKMTGGNLDVVVPPDQIVVNPQTGVREMKIAKEPQYYIVRGRLYNSLVRAGKGTPLLHEDQDFYYVEAPKDIIVDTPDETVKQLPRIYEATKEEAEEVIPPVSAVKIRFESDSAGLPDSGMWRQTFAVGDLDGDGRPEIITPPPRLSGLNPQIFKRGANGWTRVEPTFKNEENVGVDYGGVEVADFDGDGKLDLVFASHGQGLAVAINEGGFKFRMEKRGLPRGFSSRAVAAGDLNGDGRPDLVAISDAPEYLIAKRAAREGDMAATLPQPDGYVPGVDVRSYFSDGTRFTENHSGLEGSCYGYAIVLDAKPSDKGDPFLATDCRYGSVDRLIYSFDRQAAKFTPHAEAIMERWAYGTGVAIGTYRGHPAVFLSYMAHAPAGSTKKFSGDGVTAYYRTKDGWEKKRVFRTFRPPEGSAGMAVADLDGDGLDDVVYADDEQHKLRVFFQRKNGSFEELDASREPAYDNHAAAVRIADVDGDKRKDLVLMYQALSKDSNRAGGVKVFRNLR